MKTVFFPLMAASLISLTACGGGSSGGGSSGGGGGGNTNASIPKSDTPSNTNTNVVANKLASTTQIIEFYGDSTIRGYETRTGQQVETSAPQAFKQTLPASPDHTVRNFGEDGQTACQLLEGTSEKPNWPNRMINSNATVVILNHGINDGFASNERSRVTIDRYKSCLTDLARIAKAQNKRVIFETPNPIFDSGLSQYVQAMRDVAAQENLPTIDQFAYLTQQLQGRDVTTFMPDGVHPSQETYIMKGQFAAQEFQKIDK